MAVYQKIDGVWTQAQRPYLKRNGVWTAVTRAYVKRSGVWTQAYEYDITPPNPPEITLSVNEFFYTLWGSQYLGTRYITVGVRLPGGSNDTDARLVRVLTDYNGAAPTTQFGGTFTSASDSTYPNEPWSEWRYNEFGDHKDTSVYVYKQWPRNATAGTIIKGDTTYHFGGWAMDRHGNWSAATQASIHIPKDSVGTPNVITKEARFQANTSGSWRNATGYAGGELVQQKSPRSMGLWFYGQQFRNSIGANSDKITIKSAQILIHRTNDSGSASADVYLFWTPYGAVSGLPSVGTNIEKNESTKLGSIAKGQSKWFAVPTAFNNNLKNDVIKGLGLDWKDPNKADAFPADYSVIAATANDLRCGEVHMVWEEQM